MAKNRSGGLSAGKGGKLIAFGPLRSVLHETWRRTVLSILLWKKVPGVPMAKLDAAAKEIVVNELEAHP